MTERYVVLVEITPHSPISVFSPLSSVAAESFLLPPPTTLVGALAFACFRSQGDTREAETREEGARKEEQRISPTVKLLGKVHYAAAGVLGGYITFKTIERLYQHPYLRPEYYKRADMTYTIAPRAAALYNRLCLLYVVEDKSLAQFAYGITRIGRKEGLVSVDNVVCENVKEATTPSRVCSTTFYFPKHLSLSVGGDYVIQRMPVPSRRNFEKQAEGIADIESEEFVVPTPPALGALSVELSEEGVALRLKASSGIVEVPVPKSVIQGERYGQ